MIKNRNFKKIGFIGLVTAAFTTVMLALLLFNPLYANASQKSQESLGFSKNWDSQTGILEIYSNSAFRQTLEEDDVNEVLEELNITKADVKKLYIWGMNYIDKKAIYKFDNLTYLKIEEPLSTGIRLGDFSISFNSSLKTIDLGGIQWMNPDGKESDDCISYNDKLEQINITYDNWDDYQHATAYTYKLNKKISNNSLFNFDNTKSRKYYKICSLRTQDKEQKHNILYNYVGNGNPGCEHFADWDYIEGK